MKNPRFQEIKYNSKGEPFVTYYGRKFSLNEFNRFDEPYILYKANKKEPIIKANGIYSPNLLIEISPCGSGAKLLRLPKI